MAGRCTAHTQLSLGGYAGLLVGAEEGVEANVPGLTAGIDLLPSAIKLSGVGRIGFPDLKRRELRREPDVESDDGTPGAAVPMGFCYPGRGKSGDLPPRPECAPAWREPVLGCLEQVELTLVVGQYAQRYHFDGPAMSLTNRVGDWRRYWPSKVSMPHPSPLNHRWLQRNPWFEDDGLPALRTRIAEVLK